MSTGNKIKEIRKKKGLTQKELGDMLGMTASQIGNYENGYRNPKLSTVRKIAEALEVPLSTLAIDWSLFSKEEILQDLNGQSIEFTPTAEPGNEKILYPYNNLNDKGKRKVEEYATDLMNNYEYNKDGRVPNYEHYLKMKEKK